jgi:hypothetical protein
MYHAMGAPCHIDTQTPGLVEETVKNALLELQRSPSASVDLKDFVYAERIDASRPVALSTDAGLPCWLLRILVEK